MVARWSGVGWRGRKLGSGWVVSFAQQVDAPPRCLLAFGCLDPGAIDVESDAIVARIVVITSYPSMMASVTGAQHLFGFVL